MNGSPSPGVWSILGLDTTLHPAPTGYLLLWQIRERSGVEENTHTHTHATGGKRETFTLLASEVLCWCRLHPSPLSLAVTTLPSVSIIFSPSIQFPFKMTSVNLIYFSGRRWGWWVGLAEWSLFGKGRLWERGNYNTYYMFIYNFVIFLILFYLIRRIRTQLSRITE